MTVPRRQSISPAFRFVALLALGLALGIGWHLIQPGQTKARAAEVSWFKGALDTVRHAVAPGAPTKREPGLPAFALRGTIIASDPADSTAIFDLGKGRAYTLHPGNTLPGVGKLLDVTSDGVYLQVNGGRMLFTFSDSTLGPGDVLAYIPALVQGNIPNLHTGPEIRGERVPGDKFVVPADAPRYSDAPRDEPELNATPRPGQTIDTTVWD